MKHRRNARPLPALGPQYEILELLGSGGFGSVYRARHRRPHGLEKIVAVKVPGEHLTQGAALHRMRDEARVLATVRHRAIVKVEDLVPVGSSWAVVMEFVEGLDLERILEKGPVPLGVAVEVVAEIASALATAQAARGPGGRPLLLQHRDIKPGNIMITPAGEVKLLDFGIAHANLEQATDEDSDCGTLAFIAPERLQLQNHVHSDIYSLGVVFWEMLTGERFGPAGCHPELHGAHVRRRLRALGDEVPRELTVLLDEMLQFDPARRPSLRVVEARAEAIRRGAKASLRSWATARLPELLGRSQVTLPPSDLSVEPLPVPPPEQPDPPRRPVVRISGRRIFAGVLLGWSAIAAVAVGALVLRSAPGVGSGPRATEATVTDVMVDSAVEPTGSSTERRLTDGPARDARAP